MTALRGRTLPNVCGPGDALSLLTAQRGPWIVPTCDLRQHRPWSPIHIQRGEVRRTQSRDACPARPGSKIRSRFGYKSFEKEIMANHSKVRTAAEAQFRKSLKATWKGKKVTTPYEAEARAARNKTARLKELRLAKEAAEKETKTKQGIKD